MGHPKKSLDARLLCAADMVLARLRGNPSPVVADIGCDHGYLSAYLLRQRPEIRLIASDISAPSLAKARVLLEGMGLAGHARLAVADGLSALEGESPDVVVLAGMGGMTVLEILGAGALPEKTFLVVQANTDVPRVRAELALRGYLLKEEQYPEAGGRDYVVMGLERGAPRELSPREARLGLAGNGTPTPGERRVLQRRLVQLERDLGRLSGKQTARTQERRGEIDQEMTWIREVIG